MLLRMVTLVIKDNFPILSDKSPSNHKDGLNHTGTTQMVKLKSPTEPLRRFKLILQGAVEDGTRGQCRDDNDW